MANQQQNKHKQNTTKGETQIPQPDMRFAIQQRSKANSKRAGPNKNKPRTRICHGHNGKKPLCRHLRNGTNELFATQKVKHAFLIVAADRQQRNAPIAVHNCVLASQSPLIRKETHDPCADFAARAPGLSNRECHWIAPVYPVQCSLVHGYGRLFPTPLTELDRRARGTGPQDS